MTDGLAPEKVPVANKWTWKGFANSINRHFMEKMHVVVGKRQPKELYFLGLAFGGEAGELQNVIKKVWRGGGEVTPELHTKLEGEIADCYIYLQHITDWLDINADQVCANKVNECLDRWPDVPREEFYPTRYEH